MKFETQRVENINVVVLLGHSWVVPNTALVRWQLAITPVVEE
jgi:hypothetical protein